MVTHHPDNLPRWFGGQCNNVGNVAAAGSANQCAQQSTGQTARNMFALRQQTFRDSSAQAEENGTQMVSDEKRVQSNPSRRSRQMPSTLATVAAAFG